MSIVSRLCSTPLRTLESSSLYVKNCKEKMPVSYGVHSYQANTTVCDGIHTMHIIQSGIDTMHTLQSVMVFIPCTHFSL